MPRPSRIERNEILFAQQFRNLFVELFTAKVLCHDSPRRIDQKVRRNGLYGIVFRCLIVEPVEFAYVNPIHAVLFDGSQPLVAVAVE